MSDDEFLGKAANYISILIEDVNACEDAINNDDMSEMEDKGRKMEDDCRNAIDTTETIRVTIRVRGIKNLFIEIVTDFMRAGRDCQNHNVHDARDHMHSGRANARRLRREIGGLLDDFPEGFSELRSRPELLGFPELRP